MSLHYPLERGELSAELKCSPAFEIQTMDIDGQQPGTSGQGIHRGQSHLGGSKKKFSPSRLYSLTLNRVYLR